MAIDFPNSPSLNDEYIVGNRVWIWDGTVWKAKTRNLTELFDDAVNESNDYTDNAIAIHANVTTNVHGISNTLALATISDLSLKQNVVANVSSTEIGFLANVTSDIQSQINNKANSVHTHAISDVTDLASELGSKANATHSHAISDVSNLQSSLDAKANTSHSHAISDVTNLQNSLDGKANATHTHAIDDITDLSSTLSGKANTSHTHIIADISNLQDSLDAKADDAHTHPLADITDVTVSSSEINFLANVSSNVQNQLNGKASTSHSHVIGDVTNLQDSLDGKANATHTHAWTDLNNVSTTIAEINYLSGVTSNVQSQIDGKASLSGATFTGFITLHADPTQALHAVTKQYVDGIEAGIIAKPQVRAATTANLDATYSNGTLGVGGTLTSNSNGAFPLIDGVQLTTANGNRGLLVKNQTNLAHNGRYNLTTQGDENTPWVLTRCALCDEADEIPGAYIFVTDGTVNGQTGWVQHVDNPSTFTVGTDSIFVFQFAGPGTVTAGTNIEVNGNQVSVIDAPSFANLTVSTSVNFSNALITGIDVSDLGDATITSPASGDVLYWNGSDWINKYVNSIPAKMMSATITANNYTLTSGDEGMIIEVNSANATTVTIPTTEAFANGTQMIIMQTGAGQVSVIAQNTAVQTFNYSPGNALRSQWSAATLLKRGTDNWVLYGDLIAP